MHDAMAMNVTGAGYVTRGSLYDDEKIEDSSEKISEPVQLTARSTDSRLPASEVAHSRPSPARRAPTADASARATDGAVEVIRSACRDIRQVRYTKKMRGPDGQNVYYRYIVTENKKTFDCRGVGVGPVKTIPKTEAGLCDNCSSDAIGGPAQSLEQIAAQAAALAPQCPNRTSPSVLKNMFAGQACMANALKGVISALVDMIKGIGYLVGAAVSWVKGKFFGTPAVHKTDHAMTKVMNFFRTMSRAKLLSIMKNTGAWIRDMAKALKDSIWESAKNSATCEKWSGVPLASECKVKGPGWDCMNNYQKMQTACSLVGAVGSDIALLFVGGIGVGKLVARSARLMQFVNATKTVAAAAVRTTGRAVAAGGRGAQLAARVVSASASLAGGTVAFSGKTVLRALAQIDRLPLFKQYAHASEQAFLAGFKIGNRTAAGSVRAIDITARAGQVGRAADDVAGATHSFSAADIRAMTPPPPANVRPLESTAQAQTRLRTTRDFKAPKTTPQKFESRNKGRSVIPESENNRFRSQFPDPQPGGRTVVIRDEAQATNSLHLGADRSAAITTSMVERSALKFEQLAKKYKGEVNVTRFEGKNRLEVRVDPVRGTRLPDSIETEIADIYKSSVIEHTEFLKQNKLVRSNDDPTEWFKYGSGPDSHTANLTATGSRKLKGQLEARRWEDAMTQSQLETVFTRAQNLNKNFRDRYRGTPLFTADGRMTPHIADIIGKSKSAEELIEKLKPYKFLETDRNGKALTQVEKLERAEELREYVQYARNFGVDDYGARRLAAIDEICTGPGAEICRQVGRNLSHNATIFDGEYGDIVTASARAERDAAEEFETLLDQNIGPTSRGPYKVDPMANGEDVSTIIRNEDGLPAQELPVEVLLQLANCKNGVSCLRQALVPERVETVIAGNKVVISRQDVIDITRKLEDRLRSSIASKTREMDGVEFSIGVDANGRMTLNIPQSPNATRAEVILTYDRLLKSRREFQNLVETYPNPAELRGLRAAPADLPIGPRKSFPDGQDAFRLTADRQAFDSQLTLPRRDGSQSWIRPVEIYPDADQKIRGMAYLLKENGITIVQGERRALDGSGTRILGRDDKYLFIPDEVMASDAAMIKFLEANTKDLRLDPSRLQSDAARLLDAAYEKQGVVPYQIVEDNGARGLSHSNNVIGLHLGAGDDAAGVVLHELSHNSAVKKLEEIMNARPRRDWTPEQNALRFKNNEVNRRELTGRLIQFNSHNPNPAAGPYATSFRADEIEARWPQINYNARKGIDTQGVRDWMSRFIQVQGNRILRLKVAEPRDFTIRAIRDGYSRVSVEGMDFSFDVKYVINGTHEQQVAFIKSVLDDRFEKVVRYQNKLARFDAVEALPATKGLPKSLNEKATQIADIPVTSARKGTAANVKVNPLVISNEPTPQLLGLNNLLKQKNITLARGQARFANGTTQNLEGRIGDTLFVPDSALKSDETLSAYIPSQTKDLRLTRGAIVDDSVEVTLANGKTRKMPSTDAIIESAFNRQGLVVSDLPDGSDFDGLAVARNYIEIDRATPNVGSAIIHETTHNTTTEKFQRLLNAVAPEGLSNDRLAKWFKGYRRNLKEFTMRNIDFSGAGSERLGSAYKSGHRADEVEARIKEIGYQRSRNQDPSQVVEEALDFIDVQQDKIYYANLAGQDKWKIKPDGRYGAQITFNSADGKEIALAVPYVEGLTEIEQKAFINSLLTDRMKVLRGYKERLKKMYPTQKSALASANDTAPVTSREMRAAQPSAKRDSDLIGYAAKDAPPMVMPDRTNRPPRPIQTVREAAAEIRRRPGYNVRRMSTKRFVENNRARNIISKAEQKRFRKNMENPHPEGRTVVIRDFDKKKNNTLYGLDRSTAITTTLVERAAIRYQQIATKYADDVTMVRFEGPNRLEVRFEPKPGKHLPANFEAELADVFKFSVVEHADFLHQNQLVRATDNPTETFKYGSGPDSHAANLTARSNREFDNQLATYRWEDQATQTQMQTVFAHAKSLHKKIKEQYKGTDLIVKETGRIDPTIADIIAKSDTPEAIIQNLREYNVLSRDNKGRFLSREEQVSRARELDEYVESARNLGIEYYGERTPLNLKTDDTVCFGSDLCGQNGRNLSHNTSILDGKFEDVVKSSVRAEKASTDEFNVLIDNTIDARKKMLEGLGYKVDSMRSGDDVSMTIRNKDGSPVQELDDTSLRQLSNCTDGVACLRDAYVPAQIETTIKGKRAPRAKQEIIDAAHDLEKALKKKLPRRFKDRNFHVIIDKDGNMTLFMSRPKVMTEMKALELASDEAMAQAKFADMVNAMKPEETMGLRARAPSSTAPVQKPRGVDTSQLSQLDSDSLKRKQAGQNLVPSKVEQLSGTEKAEVATATGISARVAKIKDQFLAGLERRKIEKLLQEHVRADLHSGDPKARARAIKTSDDLAAAIRKRLQKMGIESRLARRPADIEHLKKVEKAYLDALARAKQIMIEQKYVGQDKKAALKMIEVVERKLNGVRLDLAEGDNTPFTRIVIGDADSKFLTGVQDKLGIEELVFDLESKQRYSTSGASFNGEEKRLQIPIETLLDSRKKDLLSDVFLHEISHAALEKKRLTGVRTPYYVRVQSLGDLPVTDMEGYEMFFSIDEVNSYRKQIANVLRGRTINKSVSIFGSFKMDTSDYLGSVGIQYRRSLNAAQSISQEARSTLRNPAHQKDILIFKDSKTPEVHIPVYREEKLAGYIQITVTDLLPTDSVETVIQKTEIYLDEVDKMLNRNFESFGN